MILDSSSKRIRVYLGGAVAANQLQWFASYADLDDAAASFFGREGSGVTNGVTPVEIVPAPAGTVQRQVKYLSVDNVDTATATVYFELYDGTQRRIFIAELLVDERVVYAHEVGWTVYTATGGPKPGIVSPLTTKGDIWGFDTADNRIPVGADDEILLADSAQALGVRWTDQIPRRPLAWVAVNAGLSPYTVLDADDVIVADAAGGPITVTLPTVASSDGRVLYVKKVDVSGNAVSADGNGAELVDGLATFDLLVQYESVTLFCDGSQWWSL
jgi:hypothetical protein